METMTQPQQELTLGPKALLRLEAFWTEAVLLGLYWGYMGVIWGLYWGYIGVIWG